MKNALFGNLWVWEHAKINFVDRRCDPFYPNKLYSDFKFILIIIVMFVNCVLHINWGLTV